MRLDKFVCKSTQLSKSEAVEKINAGEVYVNEIVIKKEATQVHENNAVFFNGNRLKAREFRYILMHKSAGTICSNIDEVYPSLFNTIDVENKSELHIVGRLDVDTTGLVLITDDGRWSFGITLPANQCEKTYRVELSKVLSDDVATLFKQGLRLQGEQKLTQPAKLVVVHPKEVLLTLTEGKFHQVKRMFTAVGNRVVSLHRESIGDIALDVEVGQWRYLTQDEVHSLNKQ